MAKLINKTQGFTIVNGSIPRDERLGMKERGLMLTLMSLPDDWDFSVLGLTKLMPDGKATIRSTVQKLEEYGYLKRVQAKDELGKFAGYDWEIIPEPSGNLPLSENRTTGDEAPLSENRSTGNRSTGKRSTGNQPQLNNKELSINKLNNKESNNLSIYQKDAYAGQALSSQEKRIDRLIDEELIEEIKKQIDYDVLINDDITYKDINLDDLDAAIDAIATLKTATSPMVFGDSTYSPEYIRGRADNIDSSHIEYVFECFYNNREEIKNIKKYLLSAVFNAPVTISSYYSNRVRSDGLV